MKISNFVDFSPLRTQTLLSNGFIDDHNWPWASLQGSVTSLSLSRQTQPGSGRSVTTPPWFSISQRELPWATTNRIQRWLHTCWYRKLCQCHVQGQQKWLKDYLTLHEPLLFSTYLSQEGIYNLRKKYKIHVFVFLPICGSSRCFWGPMRVIPSYNKVNKSAKGAVVITKTTQMKTVLNKIKAFFSWMKPFFLQQFVCFVKQE